MSVAFSTLRVGDELPPLVIEMTATLVVAGAVATRDFMPVHHDRDYANRQGAPDIFMNILSTNGLVGRFVTDWTGPGGMLTDVNIRLGAPNYPDDTMLLTGAVTAKDEAAGADGRGAVEVSIRGANGLGDHVTGTVRVLLPTAATAGGAR